MRTILLACAFALVSVAPASADEKPEHQYLESQTDIGGVIGSGKFGHRWLTRTFLNVNDEENSFEAHYGLAWKPREHLTIDATAGWAYSDAGVDTAHTLVLGVWSEAAFLQEKLRLRAEGLHRLGDGYKYEGFYAVDYSVVGLHLFHLGDQAAAGFQLGSGYGLLPFRFDIRISFGLTDGMADRTSRFVLSFDFR